ncbi:hypothetical protein [Chryseobacterium sp. ISL-6]|uniref:hypothetical protein n=1 Tax=Chryseobacterium sp. ISL-6 TaxID=2819143 RepID=UPI001BED2B3D|nr:hypothetical protein [Chryseobacterium sp. ISL-6]MBT2623735.1 hypothetical protein [Chryseobacterium sp. ISL-6]
MIVFEDIQHYFSKKSDTYLIPYDPKKHEFCELDYENIISIPKDLIAVESPFQKALDPIGWNRKGGWNLKENLKQFGLKMQFNTKLIPWDKTFIIDVIKGNLEKKQNGKQRNLKNIPKNKKGQKM